MWERLLRGAAVVTFIHLTYLSFLDRETWSVTVNLMIASVAFCLWGAVEALRIVVRRHRASPEAVMKELGLPPGARLRKDFRKVIDGLMTYAILTVVFSLAAALFLGNTTAAVAWGAWAACMLACSFGILGIFRRLRRCHHGVSGAAYSPSLCAECLVEESRAAKVGHEEESRRQRERDQGQDDYERERRERLSRKQQLRERREREEIELRERREREEVHRQEWQIRKEQERLRRQRERLESIKREEDLDTIDPIEFEKLALKIFSTKGYEVRPTQPSGDGGVDGHLKRNGKTYILQCKRYRHQVGEPILRDLFGAMHHARADGAIILTTSKVSRKARRWAEGKPIEIIERRKLLSWIKAINVDNETCPKDSVEVLEHRVEKSTAVSDPSGDRI